MLWQTKKMVGGKYYGRQKSYGRGKITRHTKNHGRRKIAGQTKKMVGGRYYDKQKIMVGGKFPGSQNKYGRMKIS
jgi:hypothetical protein